MPVAYNIKYGLTARLVFAMPQRLAKQWPDDDVREVSDRAVDRCPIGYTRSNPTALTTLMNPAGPPEP